MNDMINILKFTKSYQDFQTKLEEIQDKVRVASEEVTNLYDKREKENVSYEEYMKSPNVQTPLTESDYNQSRVAVIASLSEQIGEYDKRFDAIENEWNLFVEDKKDELERLSFALNAQISYFEVMQNNLHKEIEKANNTQEKARINRELREYTAMVKALKESTDNLTYFLGIIYDFDEFIKQENIDFSDKILDISEEIQNKITKLDENIKKIDSNPSNRLKVQIEYDEVNNKYKVSCKIDSYTLTPELSLRSDDLKNNLNEFLDQFISKVASVTPKTVMLIKKENIDLMINGENLGIIDYNNITSVISDKLNLNQNLNIAQNIDEVEQVDTKDLIEEKKEDVSKEETIVDNSEITDNNQDIVNEDDKVIEEKSDVKLDEAVIEEEQNDVKTDSTVVPSEIEEKKDIKPLNIVVNSDDMVINISIINGEKVDYSSVPFSNVEEVKNGLEEIFSKYESNLKVNAIIDEEYVSTTIENISNIIIDQYKEKITNEVPEPEEAKEEKIANFRLSIFEDENSMMIVYGNESRKINLDDYDKVMEVLRQIGNRIIEDKLNVIIMNQEAEPIVCEKQKLAEEIDKACNLKKYAKQEIVEEKPEEKEEESKQETVTEEPIKEEKTKKEEPQNEKSEIVQKIVEVNKKHRKRARIATAILGTAAVGLGISSFAAPVLAPFAEVLGVSTAGVGIPTFGGDLINALDKSNDMRRLKRIAKKHKLNLVIDNDGSVYYTAKNGEDVVKIDSSSEIAQDIQKDLDKAFKNNKRGKGESASSMGEYGRRYLQPVTIDNLAIAFEQYGGLKATEDKEENEDIKVDEQEILRRMFADQQEFTPSNLQEFGEQVRVNAETLEKEGDFTPDDEEVMANTLASEPPVIDVEPDEIRNVEEIPSNEEKTTDIKEDNDLNNPQAMIEALNMVQEELAKNVTEIKNESETAKENKEEQADDISQFVTDIDNAQQGNIPDNNEMLTTEEVKNILGQKEESAEPLTDDDIMKLFENKSQEDVKNEEQHKENPWHLSPDEIYDLLQGQDPLNTEEISKKR